MSKAQTDAVWCVQAYDVLSVPQSKVVYDRELRRKAVMEDMEETANDDLQTKWA